MGSLVPGWDEELMTPEEHRRTSVFREQLEAARRSASPAAEPSEAGANADTAAAGSSRRTAPQPTCAPRKRSASLPPAERAAATQQHHFFDDDIAWWRSADSGALNAPPARQAARAATAEAHKAAPQPLADEVEAAVRGRELPPTPPVWRDETGALHRARPHA